MKNSLSMKKMSITNFTTKFQMDPNIKITKNFTKKFGSKGIKKNIFVERLGLRHLLFSCQLLGGKDLSHLLCDLYIHVHCGRNFSNII